LFYPSLDASQRHVADTSDSAGSGAAGDFMPASRAGLASSSANMALIAVETAVKMASSAGLAGELSPTT